MKTLITSSSLTAYDDNLRKGQLSIEPSFENDALVEIRITFKEISISLSILPNEDNQNCTLGFYIQLDQDQWGYLYCSYAGDNLPLAMVVAIPDDLRNLSIHGVILRQGRLNAHPNPALKRIIENRRNEIMSQLEEFAGIAPPFDREEKKEEEESEAFLPPWRAIDEQLMLPNYDLDNTTIRKLLEEFQLEDKHYFYIHSCLLEGLQHLLESTNSKEECQIVLQDLIAPGSIGIEKSHELPDELKDHASSVRLMFSSNASILIGLNKFKKEFEEHTVNTVYNYIKSLLIYLHFQLDDSHNLENLLSETDSTISKKLTLYLEGSMEIKAPSLGEYGGAKIKDGQKNTKCQLIYTHLSPESEYMLQLIALMTTNQGIPLILEQITGARCSSLTLVKYINLRISLDRITNDTIVNDKDAQDAKMTLDAFLEVGVIEHAKEIVNSFNINQLRYSRPREEDLLPGGEELLIEQICRLPEISTNILDQILLIVSTNTVFDTLIYEHYTLRSFILNKGNIKNIISNLRMENQIETIDEILNKLQNEIAAIQSTPSALLNYLVTNNIFTTLSTFQHNGIQNFGTGTTVLNLPEWIKMFHEEVRYEALIYTFKNIPLDIPQHLQDNFRNEHQLRVFLKIFPEHQRYSVIHYLLYNHQESHTWFSDIFSNFNDLTSHLTTLAPEHRIIAYRSISRMFPETTGTTFLNILEWIKMFHKEVRYEALIYTIKNIPLDLTRNLQDNFRNEHQLRVFLKTFPEHQRYSVIHYLLYNHQESHTWFSDIFSNFNDLTSHLTTLAPEHRIIAYRSISRMFPETIAHIIKNTLNEEFFIDFLTVFKKSSDKLKALNVLMHNSEERKNFIRQILSEETDKSNFFKCFHDFEAFNVIKSMENNGIYLPEKINNITDLSRKIGILPEHSRLNSFIEFINKKIITETFLSDANQIPQFLTNFPKSKRLYAWKIFERLLRNNDIIITEVLNDLKNLVEIQEVLPTHERLEFLIRFKKLHYCNIYLNITLHQLIKAIETLENNHRLIGFKIIISILQRNGDCLSDIMHRENLNYNIIYLLTLFNQDDIFPALECITEHLNKHRKSLLDVISISQIKYKFPNVNIWELSYYIKNNIDQNELSESSFINDLINLNITTLDDIHHLENITNGRFVNFTSYLKISDILYSIEKSKQIEALQKLNDIFESNGISLLDIFPSPYVFLNMFKEENTYPAYLWFKNMLPQKCISPTDTILNRTLSNRILQSFKKEDRPHVFQEIKDDSMLNGEFPVNKFTIDLIVSTFPSNLQWEAYQSIKRTHQYLEHTEDENLTNQYEIKYKILTIDESHRIDMLKSIIDSLNIENMIPCSVLFENNNTISSHNHPPELLKCFSINDQLEALNIFLELGYEIINATHLKSILNLFPEETKADAFEIIISSLNKKGIQPVDIIKNRYELKNFLKLLIIIYKNDVLTKIKGIGIPFLSYISSNISLVELLDIFEDQKKIELFQLVINESIADPQQMENLLISNINYACDSGITISLLSSFKAKERAEVFEMISEAFQTVKSPIQKHFNSPRKIMKFLEKYFSENNTILAFNIIMENYFSTNRNLQYFFERFDLHPLFNIFQEENKIIALKIILNSIDNIDFSWDEFKLIFKALNDIISFEGIIESGTIDFFIHFLEQFIDHPDLFSLLDYTKNGLALINHTRTLKPSIYNKLLSKITINSDMNRFGLKTLLESHPEEYRLEKLMEYDEISLLEPGNSLIYNIINKHGVSIVFSYIPQDSRLDLWKYLKGHRTNPLKHHFSSTHYFFRCLKFFIDHDKQYILNEIKKIYQSVGICAIGIIPDKHHLATFLCKFSDNENQLNMAWNFITEYFHEENCLITDIISNAYDFEYLIHPINKKFILSFFSNFISTLSAEESNLSDIIKDDNDLFIILNRFENDQKLEAFREILSNPDISITSIIPNANTLASIFDLFPDDNIHIFNLFLEAINEKNINLLEFISDISNLTCILEGFRTESELDKHNQQLEIFHYLLSIFYEQEQSLSDLPNDAIDLINMLEAFPIHKRPYIFILFLDAFFNNNINPLDFILDSNAFDFLLEILPKDEHKEIIELILTKSIHNTHSLNSLIIANGLAYSARKTLLILDNLQAQPPGDPKPLSTLISSSFVFKDIFEGFSEAEHLPLLRLLPHLLNNEIEDEFESKESENESIPPSTILSNFVELIESSIEPIDNEIKRLTNDLNKRNDSLLYLDNENSSSNITQSKIHQLELFKNEIIQSIYDIQFNPSNPEDNINLLDNAHKNITQIYQSFIDNPTIQKHASNYFIDFLRNSFKGLIVTSVVGNIAVKPPFLPHSETRMLLVNCLGKSPRCHVV